MNAPKLIKICAVCKRRQAEEGQWVTDEKQGDYLPTEVSPGWCPECFIKEYGELD